MANFTTANKFDKTKNDYYTPKKNWDIIKHLISKNKTIWEACMYNATNSKSADYLRELGFNVIADTKLDMLKAEPAEHYDLIITNPPYETELKQNILKRLRDLNKPFIIIVNYTIVFSKYFREIFKDKLDKIQIILPNTKLHYFYNGDENTPKNTSFYSAFIAYKMNIPNAELFL